MKTVFFFVILFGVAIAHSETPHEVARRVIATENLISPGVINDNEESLNKAAVLVSQLRLRELMLGDSVSEELRVCYAIQRLELWLEQIGKHRGTAAIFKPTEEEWLRDRGILAAYFRRLNQTSK